MRAKARISLHEIMGENDLGRIFFDYFKTWEKVSLFELNSNERTLPTSYFITKLNEQSLYELLTSSPSFGIAALDILIKLT